MTSYLSNFLLIFCFIANFPNRRATSIRKPHFSHLNARESMFILRVFKISKYNLIGTGQFFTKNTEKSAHLLEN